MSSKIQEVILNPLSWVILLLPVSLLADITLIVHTQSNIAPTYFAYTICLYYAAACWVSRDAVKQNVYFPEDQTFVFFWISFPSYLYESRKWKGIAMFVGLIAGYILLTISYFLFTDYIYNYYFS